MTHKFTVRLNPKQYQKLAHAAKVGHCSKQKIMAALLDARPVLPEAKSDKLMAVLTKYTSELERANLNLYEAGNNLNQEVRNENQGHYDIPDYAQTETEMLAVIREIRGVIHEEEFDLWR